MSLIPRKKFFSKIQEETIVQAIRSAEKNTSGEIKVHVESRTQNPDVFARALEVFSDLEMHKTKAQNGVLFYLATKDRAFAIVADEGINQKVSEGFWDKIKEEMHSHFIGKQFSEGLSKGILMAGDALKEYFPYQKDDTNELSDDISMGE